METEQAAPEQGSRLGKVAVVMTIAVGVATIFGIVWSTFCHTNCGDGGLSAYRKQVVATCAQVHEILTAEHPEIFVEGPGPPPFRIQKDAVLAMMRQNQAMAKTAFEYLNAKAAPDPLADLHAAAMRAQQSWDKAVTDVIGMVRDRLSERATVDDLKELEKDSPTNNANVVLNRAMADLAGERCQTTG